MKTTLKMRLSKTTKGALQYKQFEQNGKAVDAEASGGDAQGLIGTLYVRKAHMEGEPQEITVIVQA